MSRIHDALRKLEKQAPVDDSSGLDQTPAKGHPARLAAEILERSGEVTVEEAPDWWSQLKTVALNPPPDAIVIRPDQVETPPAEEFRALRTRLNHLKSFQTLRTLVVTSPAPGDGKTTVALNLALAQGYLADNPTLLVDCDFRRPRIHSLVGIERAPGLVDYLLGKASLKEVMWRVKDTNLYVVPAGVATKSPLELLAQDEVKELLDRLSERFNWVIMDTPPLLFSADANLLSTLADGTLLVVRIGITTVQIVRRALQSLCENNVVGIVANGARSWDLYSSYDKYYYHKSEAETTEKETSELPS